jgi:hypothetical protein
MGFLEYGRWSTGGYIKIYYDGKFEVGEKYMKDGKQWSRGTWYLADGSE